MFKPIIKNIISDKRGILDKILKTLNESSITIDYQKEKNKVTKQIIKIEKQKDNLFNMRSRISNSFFKRSLQYLLSFFSAILCILVNIFFMYAFYGK